MRPAAEADHLEVAAREGTATQRGVRVTQQPGGWRITVHDVSVNAGPDHVASTLRRFLRRAP